MESKCCPIWTQTAKIMWEVEPRRDATPLPICRQQKSREWSCPGNRPASSWPLPPSYALAPQTNDYSERHAPADVTGIHGNRSSAVTLQRRGEKEERQRCRGKHDVWWSFSQIPAACRCAEKNDHIQYIPQYNYLLAFNFIFILTKKLLLPNRFERFHIFKI